MRIRNHPRPEGAPSRAGRTLALACMLIWTSAACVTDDTTSSSGSPDSVASDRIIDASGCPPEASEPFDGDSITIGSTGALSGPFALTGDIARGAGAYFDFVNESGGLETVDGPKQVEFELRDDEYTASVTQTRVRELVERDGVDLIAAVIGTAPNVAIAPYLAQSCIPGLWGSNGADITLSEQYPFMTQIQSYSDEGRAVGRLIAENSPSASVAVLYQNDDIGAAILAGLEEGLAGSDAEIIERQSTEQTDTEVRSQMTTLIASEADVFVNAAVTTKCPQAMNDLAGSVWKPEAVYFTLTCPAAFLAQAESSSEPHPEWVQPEYFKPLTEDDPAVAEYKEGIEAAGLQVSSQTYLGWNMAGLIANTIESADELTRIGIAEAAIELDTLPDTFRTAPERDTNGRRVSTLKLSMATWDNAQSDFGADGEVINLASDD